MMIHFKVLNVNLKTILSQQNHHLVKQVHVLLTTGMRRMPLLLLQVLSSICGPSFTCLRACAGFVSPTYSAGVHWFATAFISPTLSVRLFLGEIQRIQREVLVGKFMMKGLDLLVGECRSTLSLALATHSCWIK